MAEYEDEDAVRDPGDEGRGKSSESERAREQDGDASERQSEEKAEDARREADRITALKLRQSSASTVSKRTPSTAPRSSAAF